MYPKRIYIHILHFPKQISKIFVLVLISLNKIWRYASHSYVVTLSEAPP